MVILSNLFKFGQDAFGSSRLVSNWHRHHVNYVKNLSKLVKVHLVLAGSYQIDMVILSRLFEICQDAFGSSRLVPKWHRNRFNYVKNSPKLVKVHLELAGSYQIDMVSLINLVKFGQDAFGSSRLVPNWHCHHCNYFKILIKIGQRASGASRLAPN